MTIIIIGSEGNVGRRLKAAWPDNIGIDRVAGADIVADLATLDYGAPEVKAAFEKADGVIHVATSPNVQAEDSVHWEAVVATARLLEACDRFDIRRVVIPSSDWADPKTRWAIHNENAYGHSKRVFEAMAHMFNTRPDRHCVALRIGWVARDYAEVQAADPWLQANYWDDARLIGQMQAALGD
jgi:nucleoside-diphosphate-sugar epimerase